MKKITSFISGAILGGLIGAVAALLLAPSSGEELRANLENQANQLSEEVTTAMQERRIELEKQLKNLSQPQPKEE